MSILSEIATDAIAFLMSLPTELLVLAAVGLCGLVGVIHAAVRGDAQRLGVILMIVFIALAIVGFAFMHN